jgi:menaquinol-cytochrome c reductase iron-sulfur subunit
MSASEPLPEVTDRRRVLSMIAAAAGAAIAAIIASPVIGFLLRVRGAPQVWRTLGRVEEFVVGSTVLVKFADPSPLPWAGVTAQTAAWLRRETADRFQAFSLNCTHLGCPVRWLPTANLFMCPCHGGVFYGDGRVASGPPPRSLYNYPVRVRAGLVEILTSPLPISGR